jgi:sugar lactone lactonase YvrE
MLKLRINRKQVERGAVTAIVLFCFLLAAPYPGMAKSKKKAAAPAAKPAPPPKPQVDVTKLVWPTPPNIPRVRYVSYFAGEKLDTTPADQQPKQKSTWMDRLAGVQNADSKKYKPVPFQLLSPYGMAFGPKSELYVADQKVGAVFVFNTETKDASLIRNGYEATFGLINGVAIDDDNRLFVTDGKFHRVLVFNQKNEIVDQIKDNLIDPVGIAIDTENRLLYVVDTQGDQVAVYDADSLKPVRRLGTVGKKHEQTAPGDFSAPTGVALDADGNVYVTDTLNNRVEIFDADGKFISQFGRHCDGPGCFARPKGIAIDSDGHIWVADPMLDLLQSFNREGELLGIIGGHGELLGQFSSLVGVTIDKKTNRMVTSEQFPGRVQMFRYITDAEAEQLKKEKEALRGGQVASKQASPPAAAVTAQAKPEATPESKK